MVCMVHRMLEGDLEDQSAASRQAACGDDADEQEACMVPGNEEQDRKIPRTAR